MTGKHLLAMIFVLSLLLAGAASAQEAEPRLWLESSVEQAAAGQEFTVLVKVTDAQQVYGGSFRLVYDPAALEAVLVDGRAVAPGDFFGAAPNFPLTNAAGEGLVEYALTLIQPAEPVSGEGTLGTVTFRALRDTPVMVTPVEASLVSPEFVEVDGRMVAQRMNTIAPQMSGTVQVSAVAQNAPADSGVASAVVQPPAPTMLPSASPALLNNPVLILAGVLFLAGIGLLVISVGMYTRMRSMNLMGK